MTTTDLPSGDTRTGRSGRRRIWIAIGALAAAVVAVALALTQPWTILLNSTVDEAAPAGPGLQTTTAGEFVSIAHGTTGSARLVRTADGDVSVRIEGLDTDNGPDLKVWLSAQPATEAGAALDTAYVPLGDLKANQGNQNYPVPAGTDLSEIRSVVIWCERFRVAFGAAPLEVDGIVAAGEADRGVELVAATAPSASGTTTITTRRVGSFGRILVDGRGMPLYMFTADSRSASRCYGACAAAWPVTKAKATVRAGGAVDPDKLGSIVRRDGTRQVTYAGHPLYYYVDDRPGVALCHDVDEFGGLWLLLKASGRRVA